MHRFWPILEPILERLRPGSIVYLGPRDSRQLPLLAAHAREGEATVRALDDSRSPIESLPEVAADAGVVLVDSPRLTGQLDAVFSLLDALSPPLPGGFPVCFVTGAADGPPRAALERFLRITSRDVELAELPGADGLVVICERPLGAALHRAAELRAGGEETDARVSELEGQVVVLEAVVAQRERYSEVLESTFADQAQQLHATWASPYWRLTKPLQGLVSAARRARGRLRRGRGGPPPVTVPLSSLDWTVEESADLLGQPARWTKVSEASGRDDWRLEQDAPSRISYRVDVPPGSSLSLRAGVRAGRWASNKAPARVDVRLLAPDDAVVAEASAFVEPATDLHLDFGTGGEDCRLVLEARPAEEGSTRPTVTWEEASLFVPAPAAVRAEPARPGVRRGARRPDPLISVVMPVHDPPPAFLERALRSVRDQTYERWQLCVADDGSRDPEVSRLLRAHAAQDDRISLVRRARGGGISSGTNAALELATGEFVALLDHDDELERDALERVVECLREHPDTDIVYTDEDRLLPDGTRFGAVLKPGWSPELLRCGMYTCHLGVYRRALVEEAGGLRGDYDGAQDFDLMLRLVERTQRVRHVPRVLYHWRASDASVAINPAAKPYAYEAGARALQSHLDRVGIAGTAERTELPGLYRTVHAPDPEAKVSILLAAERAPEGWERAIGERTAHPSWELVVAPTLGEAARRATGEYLLILDAPAVPLDDAWLTTLIGHARLEGVAAVGAKVLRPGGVIEHAGVMIGEGLPLPVYRGVRADFVGYLGNLAVSWNYCAVAGALMTRRDLFTELGGLGGGRSPLAEADYCLRARGRGLRTVLAPDARLQLTGPGRGEAASLRELAAFKRRWQPEVPVDPYYPKFWQRRGALPSPPPVGPLVAPAQAEDGKQERREEDLDPHDDQRGGPHREALL
jgi:GT2 family glycosyltransferase